MSETTAEIIETALALLDDEYIFPDKADQAASAIRGALAAGDFDGLDGPALCVKTTELFYESCADRHLRLLWNDEPQPVDSEDDDEEEDDARFREMARGENYGIHRVERLEDNIGYLDLRLIANPGDGARAIHAAMELLTHTRALIIDLRRNRGGSPAGVQLWCSYFFPDDDVHLNDIYTRKTDSTRQFWTLTDLPGERYLDRPVYVLTSSTTFSGGEELAYNLKAYKRATLIGETTRGGAHPTSWHQITPHVTVTVPGARSINPVTGTNWEGVGVEPDVAASAEDAFELARQDALAKLGS